jgi:predicted dehydrogenase
MSETNTTCRVAVIGAGYTAREHIRAFADVPGTVVVGIYSRTRAKAESLAKEFAIPLVCDSIEELQAKTQADLVVVTVPELSMRVVSIACFKYSWTVLLEKPAGYNIVDARAIKDAAEARQRKVFVALNRRFYSSVKAVQQDLEARTGARFIKVLDQEDPQAALAAGQPSLVTENWMYANSIHMIDLFRVMGRGKVVKVEPVIPWDGGRSMMVVGKITFDSGDVGLYEGVWNAPGPWALTVNTPLRRWELRPVEQAGFQDRGQRKLSPVEISAWDQTFKPGFRAQAQHAVAAALGLPSDSVLLADAFSSMELVQAIFQDV